jgi:K+-transporting ATPase ATPase B chain
MATPTSACASAGAQLRRNLMIYVIGGIIIPFIGIKAIDLAVAALHLA